MPKYISKLQGRRVLVLGGTSGIGFCVAEAALEHGATVIISSSKQAKVDDSVLRLINSTGKNTVSGHVCDLANPDMAEANIIELVKLATQGGKLDHVVHTAGDSLDLPKFSDVTVERLYAAQQVRFVCGMLLAKNCAQHMHSSNSSSFTLTSGVNTHKPGKGWSIAAAAGGAIEGLVRGLAVDMAPVRVNAVAPGAVMTELWQATFKTAEEVKRIEEIYSKKLLTGEIGRPEDVAEAYLYLMKDKFADGQVLLSEGGFLLL